MLPNRIRLSTNATNKMQYLKSKTGITPNILSRFAIMLAIKDDSNLKNAGTQDLDGQVLDKSVLFGEHSDIYDVLINQYIYDNKIDLDIQKSIASLIEVGIHKMGHIKNLVDICNLK
ncbi:MAG: DndE family protein [Pseudomonadota bacterium]